MDFQLLFNDFPNLENDTVFTKRIDYSDEKAFIEIYRNPHCFTYTPGSERKSDAAASNVIAHFIRYFKKNRFIFVGLYLKENQQLIGVLEVFNIDKKLDSVEIGYRLHQQYWHKGYASLGTSLLVKYLFDIINVKVIYATAMVNNESSNRLLHRLGFTLIKTSIQEVEWKDKGLVNLNHYEMHSSLQAKQ